MCSRLYLSFNPDATVCSLDHTDIISSVTCHKITNYMMQFLEVAAVMGILNQWVFTAILWTHAVILSLRLHDSFSNPTKISDVKLSHLGWDGSLTLKLCVFLWSTLQTSWAFIPNTSIKSVWFNLSVHQSFINGKHFPLEKMGLNSHRYFSR